MVRGGFVFLMAAVSAGQARQSPARILKAFDAMSAKALWPGFDPSKIPLAIFDGKRTWLFRHPHPPPGFAPSGDGWWVMEGRCEAVAANSSADIGGVMTATLMPAAGLSPETRAATMIHECFHVYQRKAHPSWAGNEAELFAYPMVDGEVLASRWEEEADLWSALRAEDGGLAKAYAKRAMAARARRFARIGEGPSIYERGCELNEGLATLVEFRAAGRRAFDGAAPPRIGAENLRNERVYAMGPAFGQLLDRFRPGWEAELDSGKVLTLDAALSQAVQDADISSLPPLDPAIHAEAQSAGRAAEASRAGRQALYLAQPGWSIDIVATKGHPLQAKRFDPWNVQSLAPGCVLHTRYLKLGNEDGEVEILNQSGLTESAGKHPLWDGIARFRVAGLKAKPSLVQLSDGTWNLRAEGLEGTLKRAALVWKGQTLEIALGSR